MSWQTALITGNSSGIGLGLTGQLLADAARVYGISRRGCPLEHESLHDVQADLADESAAETALQTLLGGVNRLDLVVLNAGILGTMDDLSATPLTELRVTMDINLWSNKTVLDVLLRQNIDVGQIVFMSSGAAVNGNRGWGGYALSKAALNMMAQLYRHEFTGSQVHAFAPGLVDTPMQAILCDEIGSERFGSIRHLQAARGTAAMPKAEDAGPILLRAFAQLPQHANGSFVDIRALR